MIIIIIMMLMMMLLAAVYCIGAHCRVREQQAAAAVAACFHYVTNRLDAIHPHLLLLIIIIMLPGCLDAWMYGIWMQYILISLF